MALCPKIFNIMDNNENKKENKKEYFAKPEKVYLQGKI